MSPKDQTSGQIIRFLLVSAVAITIDAILYALLANVFDFGEALSKRVSFAVASVWGFVASKYFTFRQPAVRIGEPIKFFLLYLTSWLINGYAHDIILATWQSKTAAFLNASALAAIWNFSGQKWFVFKNHNEDSSSVSNNQG